MKYFKNIENNYIVSISTHHGQIEISEAEYNNILFLIRNAPKAQDGFAYRLREDLAWELTVVEAETPIGDER